MARHPSPCLFIGAGKMGGALLEGWRLGKGYQGDIDICDPQLALSGHLKTYKNLRRLVTPAIAADSYALVVLAVKPSQASAALSPWRKALRKDCLLVSIMAGVSLAQLRQWAAPAACVRCMPNLPSALGVGALVFCGDVRHSSILREIFLANGDVFWLDDTQEDLLHTVTAISGSGSAYVFYLAQLLGKDWAQAKEMEWLQDGLTRLSEALGLPLAMGMRLAEQTLLGARLQLQQANVSARMLYEAVASKGGTTAAALRCLQDPTSGWPAALAGRRDEGQFQAVLAQAVHAAHQRSLELSRS